MGKPSAPEPPDFSQANEISERLANRQMDIGEEQWEWAKEEGILNRETMERVLDQQMGAMDQQLAQASEDRDYYMEVFRPIEEDLARKAQEYDTPERREQEAARAQAGIAQAADAQREQSLRQLESYGIDPSQTRFQALDKNLRAQEAAQQAGAGNQARRGVEERGLAMQGEMANMGRGMGVDISRSYMQGAAAGQMGLTGALNTTGSTSGAMQGAQGAFSGANQAVGTWGNNLYNQGNLANQAYNSASQSSGAFWGGIGQLGGMALGAGMPGANAGTFGGQLLSKLPGFEHGGEVPNRPALDIPGSTDSVPAALTPGEYVLPTEVVRGMGTDKLDKMVEKYTGEEPPENAPMVYGREMRRSGGYIEQPYNMYKSGGVAVPALMPVSAGY